jgi:putative cardiolipin synthase
MATKRWMGRLAPALLALLLAGCATNSIREDYLKPSSTALPTPVDTPVAASVDAAVEARGAAGQSGFRLLTLNTNALMSRLALADKAERSIDLQYYIYRNDATGKLVAQHLLSAADRGVRVRMLVDDITSADAKPLYDALDAHGNIEVRRFNPFNTHQPGVLSRAAQILVEFRRLNRRMHNKSFIVDNKVAIVGGRNIADDYFDAADDQNYRDLDLLAVGPVVEQSSRSFDAYWNDEASVPANAFVAAKNDEAALASLRTELARHVREFAQSDYVEAAGQDLPDGPTADRSGTWFWGVSTLIADQPGKIAGDDGPGLHIGPAMEELIDGARTDLTMISPYFVPSEADDKRFLALIARGARLRLVTNSLASTDEPAVHSGYVEHRRTLLKGGAQIWELKPRAGRRQSRTEVGSDASIALHAKAVVVDARWTFIGSMNMDNRSKLLNTEMGFLVDSPALSKAVLAYFDSLVVPANAYRVEFGDSGLMRWHTEEVGKPVVIKDEPEASMLRRAEVILLKLLPIDGLL